ncbi:MAG TPA: zeta toxin family protein [Thermoanaerobaculia bacterium]
MAEANRPNVYIVAGPNGAGKSTFARLFLPDYADCREFVNADLIAAGLSPFNPESLAIEAGRLMLGRIEALAQTRVDFGFETTLAGRSQMALLTKLRNVGYRTHIFFLWLPTPELAVERVRDRVLSGGHFVPEETVRRRFTRGLSNFFHLYQPLLDTYLIFDTSESTPRLVALRVEDQPPIVLDSMTFGRIRAGARPQ